MTLRAISTVLDNKLERLAKLIEVQSELDNIRRGFGHEIHMAEIETHIHIGKKYARIDRGSGGMLMIDLETEEIFGIKAYGKVHKGHRYGTLDTIDRFHWGTYNPDGRYSQQTQRLEGVANSYRHHPTVGKE